MSLFSVRLLSVLGGCSSLFLAAAFCQADEPRQPVKAEKIETVAVESDESKSGIVETASSSIQITTKKSDFARNQEPLKLKIDSGFKSAESEPKPAMKPAETEKTESEEQESSPKEDSTPDRDAPELLKELKPVPVVKPTDPLLIKVDQAIEYSRQRFLNADVHTPWQLMHGILAFRDKYQINQDNKKINALEFISSGPTFQNEHWFQKTKFGGRAHPFSVPYAFEGHPNQFVAILTMTDVPLDHQFKTADGPITMADIVKHAQMEVTHREGTTWTLWFLAHYLPYDAEWRNKSGEYWSIERLVQIQNKVVVEKAACGGCHNLFALSLSRNNQLQETGSIRGVWMEADQKIRRYTEIARRTQNRDGSFSSDYLRSRKYSKEFKRRIATSGHILEFLMAALPQNRLKEQWVRNAVNNIANDLIRFRSEPADVGALYHAVDSLVLFRERMLPPAVPTELAEGGQEEE